MLQNLKVRSKLFVIVCAVSLLFLTTFVSLGWVAHHHVARTMDTELERSRKIIHEFLASRWRHLDAGLHSLVDSPEIRAVLITEGIDQETILTSITDLQHMLGVDTVLFCDHQGKTLARTDDPFNSNPDTLDIPLIQVALGGKSATGFWSVDGHILLAKAYPVDNEGVPKGIVLAGVSIEQEADALRALLLRDVIVSRNGVVFLTSVPQDSGIDLERLLRQPETHPNDLGRLPTFALTSANVEATQRDKQIMAASVRFQPIENEEIHCCVLIPVSSVFGFYYDFRSVLLLTGSIAMGLSLLLCFHVGTIISSQVRRTVEKLKRFAEGDLTVRLNIESRDEFGSIARSLNTAIEASAKSFNELATCNREMNTLLNKVEQAREEKEKLYEELLTVARQAGMAEVATDVLHNVGNVLNSVNVSAQVVAEKLHANRAEGLVRACSLIDQHRSSIGSFFSTDARGQKLPEFLSKLADVLVRENNEVVAEMAQLVENIEHIKHIVSMQQSLAKSCSLQEPVDLIKLLENAERMNDSSLTRHAVTVYRDFNVIPTVVTDKHKVLQVLVNLIKNAKQAVSTEPQEERWIRLSIDQPNPSTVNIKVSDNGVGITTENLGKLFTHGFTTRKTGHGFGLHSGALAAKELGGRLSVHSDGPGLGATFTLELPVASEIVSLDSALTNAPMLNSMSTSECISNFV